MSECEPAPLVRLEDVHFAYGPGEFELSVARFEQAAGTRLACVGPSGSGKTTWLHLLSGVLAADRGRVEIGGVDLGALSEPARRALRVRAIGMVFQEFELLDYLDALDNILLPYHLDRRLALTDEVRARARTLATELGIEARLRQSPDKLSQGERQRVALCRALVTQPKLLLCDEATGNLDPGATRASLELLFEAVERRGAALVFVTHDHSLLDLFERVVEIEQFVAARPEAGA